MHDRRIVVPAMAAGLAALGAIMLAVQRGGLRLAMAQDWSVGMQSLMASNWVALGLGQTLIAASGILPASMIAVMAGATLGFGWGLAISSASTLLGGWIAFSLSRSALRGWIAQYLRRHAVIARLDDAMTSEGWKVVALLRISPVMPFALTSYGFGLTRMSQRNFLLGTLASLPALVGYVGLGALGYQGLMLASGGARTWRMLALTAGVAVVFYALHRVKKAVGGLAI